MTKSVMITPDGNILEVTEEEENMSKRGRVWDGRSLLAPEHWGNDRKFRLTLTFPDLYEDSDAFNPLATMLLYNLRHPKFKTVDVICGTAYLSNETLAEIIDFTIDDLKHIMRTPEIQNR